MLIDLFIQEGWYTVPLEGKLERLSNGKKTLPIFESNWKKYYAENFNKKRVPLAGALTGKASGFIAIDCDNQLTYDTFRALDPTNEFLFISKGKQSGGGTILYKYTDSVGTFSLKAQEIELDFFADDGFIYLPTESNLTKESWFNVTKLPELKEAPSTVISLLKILKSKTPSSIPVKTNDIKRSISNRLAPMLETLVKSKKYDPVVFKILTPYSFRDLPQYIAKGHLHPNDVPKGRGSEYMVKVSSILGADISVSIELYTNVMLFINSLWSEPMETNKFMATIINPMVEGRSNVDGKVIWQYDQYWEQMGFIATSLNGDYIESFYDDVKGLYYIVNYSVPYIKTFGDKRPVITTLKTLLGRNLTEAIYDSSKQLIRTTLNPSLEFGHIEGSECFNLFRQTRELSILNNPEPYKEQYVRPIHIIKYFESLIPDDFMRSYVLSFIKTKLTTFDYSPVVLYLIGKPGSGKDTLVSILAKIVGQEYTSKPDTKVFLEQYNGWMIDKYIIQLDEYGNKLVRNSDKQEALGKIKAYTGSSEIQIRAMRQDGFNYHHCATFIMTANSNPLPIENEDRRIAFIKTPNKLATQDWVSAAGGVRHVVEKLIPSEITDFCYYLATEVNALTGNDYVIAPETEDKEKIIIDSLPAAEQITYYMQNSKFDELKELAEEYAVNNFTEDWDKNKIWDDKISELYENITDGKGNHRVVIRALKNSGIHRQHTTRNGNNRFYYFLNDLHRFVDNKNEYAESSFTQTSIKGIE